MWKTLVEVDKNRSADDPCRQRCDSQCCTAINAVRESEKERNMTATEYDQAISTMAAEPLDIDERQHFEELRACYDTPDKQRGRKRRERERMKAAAQKAGFNSVVELCNAINADEVEIVKLPAQPAIVGGTVAPATPTGAPRVERTAVDAGRLRAVAG